MNEETPGPARLERSIGLWGMVFYGVGTIIGGGFYALLGKIVGQAGPFTLICLLLAGALALITALSFAELSRRFPVSAGEAHYVQSAFGRRRLSRLVGLLVILTGVVSAATLCVATGGFILDLTGVRAQWLIALTAIALTAIAAWGVAESVAVVAVITLIEAGTLLLIIALSGERLLELPGVLRDMFEQRDQFHAGVLVATAFLAFYAFVGFEDMVNMAEEVRDAERTLPRAIHIAVAITLLLYTGVAIVAIGLPDRAAFASANTPLALLLPQTRYGDLIIGIVSVLAGLNGALVQLIMASRVLYGMASSGMAPRLFARVNRRTRTPLAATLLAGAVILALATSFSLTGLAQATSFIILLVFALVNLSLATLRWRESESHRAATIPWLPLVAACSCMAMLLLRLAG
jgi:APA family basic amino acid/polyamine antiporter